MSEKLQEKDARSFVLFQKVKRLAGEKEHYHQIIIDLYDELFRLIGEKNQDTKTKGQFHAIIMDLYDTMFGNLKELDEQAKALEAKDVSLETQQRGLSRKSKLVEHLYELIETLKEKPRLLQEQFDELSDRIESDLKPENKALLSRIDQLMTKQRELETELEKKEQAIRAGQIQANGQALLIDALIEQHKERDVRDGLALASLDVSLEKKPVKN
jgi:chromosome segregation ATPase